MGDDLYPYYERELIFIRQFAQEFARKYPASAGRLMLEPSRSADPHVERLIEAFALLSGRIHHKLDDEFPELIQAVLNVVYPHYLAPVPSMAVLQFDLDASRADLPDGFAVPAGSRLRTLPDGPASCRYRTGYPVKLWPIRVEDARFLLPPFPPGTPSPPPKTEAVVRLRFVCDGGLPLSGLSVDSVRFFLSGEPTLVASLYELLFNHATSVVFRPVDPPGSAAKPLTVTFDPAEALGQVGFEADEGLLPYPRQSFPGYRLLAELFAFPSKFLFVDLKGFGAAARAGFGRRFEALVYLDRGGETQEQGVNTETFRLGCTPVVNLFDQTAEPIPLTETRSEYRVVPDVGRAMGTEVYSVESVLGTSAATGRSRPYRPFYSFRHGLSREADRGFFVASRRASRQDGDRGTDVFLSLVDLAFDPYQPEETTLVVRTTCTNRDLPAELRRAGDRLIFELEGAAPLSAIRCLRSPTLPLRPPTRRGAFWRLVSHLNLNHLSLTDSDEGRDALREVLRLYDFSEAATNAPGAAVNAQLVEGLAGVHSRRVTARVEPRGDDGDGFDAEGGVCRGVEITIDLDEEQFVGTGAFLFASVLERFFGLHASVNSFTQTVARSTQRGGRIIKRWPPRAGFRTLT